MRRNVRYSPRPEDSVVVFFVLRRAGGWGLVWGRVVFCFVLFLLALQAICTRNGESGMNDEVMDAFRIGRRNGERPATGAR